MGLMEFLVLGFDLWVLMDVMMILFVLFMKLEDSVSLSVGFSNFVMFIFEMLGVMVYEMGGSLLFMLSSMYFLVSLLVFFLSFFGLMMYCGSLTSYFILSFWVSFSFWFCLSIVGELMVFSRMYELYRLDIMPRLVMALCLMETFSFMLSGISLAVRMSANLVSGHLLLFFMMVLPLVAMHDVFLISVMSVSLLPYMFYMFVEVGVCMVQSYIFGFLTLMYMNGILE